MPEEVVAPAGRLARRYGCVACISGRSAAEARRLVGVGGIAYAGSHGAELLEPGAATPARDPGLQELGAARAPLRRRARHAGAARCCGCGSRTRGRSPPSTGAACPTRRRRSPASRRSRTRRRPTGSRSTGAARCSRSGRRCRSTRATPCATWCDRRRRCAPRSTAATTPPTSTRFEALDELEAEGALDAGVRVGVRSDEGPAAIVERADLVVDGVDGFTRVLAALAAD